MLEIVSAPPLNTVQDLGRPGYRGIGLCQGGAMDGLALTLGNIMVGNPETAAGIEIQTFPFRLRATQGHLVAVTGADCPVKLGDALLPPWWAMRIAAGQELAIERPRRGARAYLAVHGGVDVEPLLGSRSTDLRSGFGGFEGRALRRGDALSVGAGDGLRPEVGRDGFGVEPPMLALPLEERRGADIVLRATRGPEHDEFDEASRGSFWSGAWVVTPMADRMGIRLVGDSSLRLSAHRELRSGGILSGVVQAPPSGEPLIQLQDANSAGGYPRIAVVIKADLWRAAQAKPGDRIGFVAVSHDEAIAAQRESAAYVRRVGATAVKFAALDAIGAGR